MLDLAVLATTLLAACVVVAVWPRSWIALIIFLSLAAMPVAVPPIVGNAGWIALAVGAAFCLHRFDARRSTDIPAAALIIATTLFALWGLSNSNPPGDVFADCKGILILGLALFVFGRIAGTDLLVAALRGLAATLWFSFACAVLSIVTGLSLTGRARDASLFAEGDNTTDVVRLLTPSTHLATGVLAVSIGLWTLRPRLAAATIPYVIPAFGLAVLALSRNSILVIAIALILAPILNRNVRALIRAIIFMFCGVVAYFLAGWALTYLDDIRPFGQIRSIYNAYTGRVIEGMFGDQALRDKSLEYRRIEMDYLFRAISDYEMFGHGYGYSYKPPRDGRPITAWFAHNYYLWTIVKTGMTGFLIHTVAYISPISQALRRPLNPYRSACAAAALALLAVSWAVPYAAAPESAVVLGALLGCAAAVGNPAAPSFRTVARNVSAHAVHRTF
ncbi:O-antigen ligase family protein [Mycolicibacterium austroafricanum]|uniref:O-antigen ligase family protein n=1 Tax=Mycolicibacterium austroafricanum TaxID=39687 RepID=UPI001CA30641|nr:O-antigen ligase family protein [Mycolicibacterium austroafricanum]QZT58428.1 O-antigen ligase family protein [Mycolicibacterium austroafricanum]